MTRRPSPIRAVGAPTTSFLLLATLCLVGATPAQASTFDQIASEEQLLDALTAANAATDADTIVLTEDAEITTGQRIVIAAPATLDLNGGTLTSAGVEIAGTGEVLITGGRLIAGVADGVDTVPGIEVELGRSLVLDAVDVTAVGGRNAAGIGGRANQDAGAITIRNASKVLATGGAEGAGIGGGDSGGGGSVTIRDSTVTALGAGNGAGIGGGTYGDAADVLIVRSDVTARSEQGGSGIGHGATTNEFTYDGVTTIEGASTLEVSGLTGEIWKVDGLAWTLRGTNPTYLLGSLVTTGTLTIENEVVIRSGASVRNSGFITGPGSFTGEGAVVNNGAICAAIDDEAVDPLDPSAGLAVSGNAYYLPYRYPSGVTVTNVVYAVAMEFSCRALPDVSYLPDGETTPLINVGWTLTEDGSGPFVTEETLLADVVPTGSGTLWPTMVPAEITATATPGAVDAGETTTLEVTGPWPLSNATTIDLTDRATFSDEGQTPGATNGELSFAKQGEKTVTASVDYLIESEPFIATDDVTIVVAPTALASLEITPSATTVPQGGSVLLQVTGLDEFGNELTILQGDITVTSSVQTDVIDGLRVTFPTASPHVLTVTVGEVSAQVTIEVQPAAAPARPGAPGLAATGASDVSPLAAIALLMLVLGAASMGAHRIRDRRSLPTTGR